MLEALAWRRVRALSATITMALLLAFAALPPAPAWAQTAAPAAQPRPTAAADTNLAAMTEAYLLLLEHYAVPLEPAPLVAAGQTGMIDALRGVGIDAAPLDPASYGTGKVEEFAVLQHQYQTFVERAAGALSPTDLAYAAIKGMAESVNDAHTNFLTPEEYQEERRWERGEVNYGGIGARMRGPQATVLEVFPDSPAQRAGLQPGDTIVAVDGQPTTDLKLEEVVKLVRGPEGTPVALRIQRGVTGRVDDLTLVRAQVAAPFVSSRRVAGDLGYVQLRGFPDTSVVREVEQAIREQQQAGIRGLIFDLRGNGGGRLGVGEQLLADFVPSGPIYQIVDREGHREVQNVRSARRLVTVPLVVLIDEGTASMGEVFAAAVQEHHVAQLIGQTTAGAVAASRFVPLSGGAALQISIEQVYSGAGALLDRTGVHPDQEVTLDLDQLRQGRDTQLEQAIAYLRSVAGS